MKLARRFFEWRGTSSWALARIVVSTVALVATVTAGILATPAVTSSASRPSVDVLLQIVRTHDETGQPQPSGSAPYVDVEAYLFDTGALNPVACLFPNDVVLHWSQNYVFNTTGVASRLVAAPDRGNLARSSVGRRELRIIDDKTVPVWVFDNIPVYPPPFRQIARQSKTYFWADVAGSDSRSIVAAYGVGPVTLSAMLDNPPERVGGPIPDTVEARVQVLSSHDASGQSRSSKEAGLVDIGVDLAAIPSDATWGWTSVGFGFDRPVSLLRSINDGFLTTVKTADEIRSVTYTYPDGTVKSWPRWIFRDVDVSDAPGTTNQYYFSAQVDGTTTLPTIWSYGADPYFASPTKDGQIINRKPATASCSTDAGPTATPNAAAVSISTATPTDTPNAAAVVFPTATPTDTPTDAAVGTSTATPTDRPTDAAAGSSTSTPTDTPTEAPVDSPTDVPTDTASPINASTDTPTATPPPATSTSTSIPRSPTPYRSPTPRRATSTPISVPPSPTPPSVRSSPTTVPTAVPILGTASNFGGAILLTWSYPGELASDEYFDVRVWQSGQAPDGIANVKGTSYQIGGNFPSGTYNWTIAVIRRLSDGSVETLSAAASTSTFTWSGASHPGGCDRANNPSCG